MKKVILGIIIGALLTLSVTTYAGIRAEEPTPQAVCVTPAPTPQIVYRDVVKEVIKEVEVIRLTDLETVVQNVKNSCVMIYTYNKDGSIEQGSGWAYNGYIVTAKHLVDGASKIEIFTDDYKYAVAGGIEYIDLTLDVAILRVGKTLPSVTLGDSDALIEGEKLVSITSPEGAMNMIDECLYSGKVITETEDHIALTDTLIQGGSSGGAVFCYDSKLMGMVFIGNDGFAGAIPINKIKPILEKLK